MIDLHCHVLPDVDDGASSLEVSRNMLKAFRASGFTTVLATPHLLGPLTPDYEQLVHRAFKYVEPIAHELGIELVQGFEVKLSPDLPGRLATGEAITLGAGRAVLVDLCLPEWPASIDDTLFAIQISGYQPVLAHPERYRYIQKDPRLGLHLASRGIAMQVTIGSLVGVFGPRARRAAEKLIAMGAVHLVATDAHSLGSRMDAVPAGLRRLEQLVGHDQARQLLRDNPLALLSGNALPGGVSCIERKWRFGLPRARYLQHTGGRLRSI